MLISVKKFISKYDASIYENYEKQVLKYASHPDFIFTKYNYAQLNNEAAREYIETGRDIPYDMIEMMGVPFNLYPEIALINQAKRIERLKKINLNGEDVLALSREWLQIFTTLIYIRGPQSKMFIYDSVKEWFVSPSEPPNLYLIDKFLGEYGDLNWMRSRFSSVARIGKSQPKACAMF